MEKELLSEIKECCDSNKILRTDLFQTNQELKKYRIIKQRVQSYESMKRFVSYLDFKLSDYGNKISKIQNTLKVNKNLITFDLQIYKEFRDKEKAYNRIKNKITLSLHAYLRYLRRIEKEYIPEKQIVWNAKVLVRKFKYKYPLEKIKDKLLNEFVAEEIEKNNGNCEVHIGKIKIVVRDYVIVTMYKKDKEI